MEAIRASNLFIVIHFVAWHLKHIAYIVVKLTSMNIGKVRAQCLVCKEITIDSYRQELVFHERVKFIDCTGGRVEIQFSDKLEHRDTIKTFSKKVQDTACNKI